MKLSSFFKQPHCIEMTNRLFLKQEVTNYKQSSVFLEFYGLEKRVTLINHLKIAYFRWRVLTYEHELIEVSLGQSRYLDSPMHR